MTKDLTDQEIGEALINAIVEGRLLSSDCTIDEDHQILHVWSSGAADQLGAVARGLLCPPHPGDYE